MSTDRLFELVEATGSQDPIAGLAATAALRAELERNEAVLVRRARVAGVTWAQIAAALGVSKQAVHKKYGGRLLSGGRS